MNRIRNWRLWGAALTLTAGCVAAPVGCGGGGGSGLGPNDDAGAEGGGSEGGDDGSPGTDATTEAGGGDSGASGHDGSTGDSGHDSGTTADSGTASDSGAAADSGTAADGGATADSGAMADSGTAADSGCVAGGACSLGASDGVCSSGGTCAQCTLDAQCSGAYGGGYICSSAGTCVLGNCTTDANCPSGQICGLVTPNVCGNCTTDTQCQTDTTYGLGDICVSGLCTAGNCHTDANCPQGEICGLTKAYLCGPCTTDTQCKSDATYGAGDVCDTAAGACVSDSCAAPNTACSVNASDECCSVNGSDVCVAGNCCGNAQCSSATPACEGNVCTVCDAVGSPWVYNVDPVNGVNDTGTTGSGTAAGQANSVCAFKTITAAIAYILSQSTPPQAGTQIVVKGPSTVSLASSGETFPITVPQNVSITGGGTGVTVNVTAGSSGFVLNSAGSGVAALTLDGLSHTAVNGVQAGSGSVSTLTGVTVQNFFAEGILVNGSASLAITGGTQSMKNGTSAVPSSGLHVTGTAIATISGGNNGAPTAFSQNTLYGIQIDGSGSIGLTGAAGVAGVGTVVANTNASDNVFISQTVASSPPYPPTSNVDGLVAYGSTAGNGLRIEGGSGLTLRNSYILGNALSGVRAETNSAGGGGANNFTRVDLGNAGTLPIQWGLNVVQDGGNGHPNQAVGICFAVTAGLALTLNAAGDIFSNTINCSTTASPLTKNNTCAAGSTQQDIGIVGAVTNTVTTDHCTN